MSYVRQTTDGGFEVRITVPKRLQSFVGKSNLTKRLGRVSRSNANRLAMPVIQQFRMQLDAAGRGKVCDLPSPELAIEPVAPGPKRAFASNPSIQDLFDGYVAERRPAASTVKRWRPVFDSLVKHLGHSDASRIEAEDFVAWKDALFAAGKSPRTIREVYLAAAKVVCSWAVENRKLLSNPVAGVTVRVPKAGRLRERGFTKEEAARILRATLQPIDDRISREHARARRWIPWLCAYSGCRVGEVAQIRGCDFFQQDGYWVMRITPAAGSTKSGSARLVPLHSHLIEQGFVQAIRDLGQGPIFYDSERARGGSLGNPHSKKVGERIASWPKLNSAGRTCGERQALSS